MRARDVSVRIGGRWVLREVSCEIAPGEVLGVVGPNAAGKSTLLAALTGERSPVCGEVSIGGRALGAHDARELARARAVVRQRSEVAFDLTALDVVLLGRFAHRGRGDAREDVEAAHAALDEVDLGGVAERPYGHLSGGEQRRVQIARAFAQVAASGARGRPGANEGARPGGARFLLLDEPLANLDLCHQLEVLALLRRKAAEGLGVAVVLHEIGLAGRACDRVLVLHEGRVADEGPPAEVLTPELLARVFRVEATVRADTRAGLVIDVLGPAPALSG